MANEIDAVVTQASDVDFDAKVFPNTDQSVGGKRAKVIVRFQNVAPQVLEFAGLTDHSGEVYGGGWGQKRHQEYLYLKSLGVGEMVKITPYPKDNGRVDLDIVIPPGWQPGQAPVMPANGTDASTPAPAAPAEAPRPTSVRGIGPLTPEQRLHALLKLYDEEWLFDEALNVSVRLLRGLEVSDEQIARTANAMLTGVSAWKVREQAFFPSDFDMRTPMKPAELYQWFTGEVKKRGAMATNEQQAIYAIASLSKLFPDEEVRHKFTKRMFGNESSNDLNGAQRAAIIDWVGATAKNGWRPCPEAVVEAGLVREVL